MMPQGLGIWIAYWDRADRGNTALMIPKMNRCGIRWVAPRINSTFELQNLKVHLHDLKDAGIGVFPWRYVYPGKSDNDVWFAKQAFQYGADGFILDAEAEWENVPAHREAMNLMSELRKDLPTQFIAHAPFDYCEYHRMFPYKEFNEQCDAVMPQAYWTEHNDNGAKFNLDRIDHQWLNYEDAPPILPIGVTYGRESGWGKPPGRFKKEDLLHFLGRYPQIPISLYSYEAAEQVCWDTLEQVVRAADAGQSVKGSAP